MSELPILLALGLAAGALSTLAGLGGGLVLTLALATLWDPTRALATAAPALLVGNVHRIALFRRHLDRRFVAPFILGAVPGAAVGGLMAVALPDHVLRLLILGTALAAAAHELHGRASERAWPAPSAAFIAGAAFVAGGITATSGGGGLLLGPLLLAAGARGERFLVSASTIAVCMHVTRIAAYGASDVVSVQTFLDAAIVAAAILAGNAVARRARKPLGLAGESRRGTRLTYVVLGVSIILAVAGLA